MKALGNGLIFLGFILVIASILVLVLYGIESFSAWSDILFWVGLIVTTAGVLLTKPFSDENKEPARLGN